MSKLSSNGPLRHVVFCSLCLWAGCSEQQSAPPVLAPEYRQATKLSLLKLGSKVTAEVPEGVYLSLRNSHVRVQELGVAVESAPRIGRDIQDFAKTNEAVASALLGPSELDNFKKWLAAALAPRASPTHRDEYQKFMVTLSRKPLRTLFLPTVGATGE